MSYRDFHSTDPQSPRPAFTYVEKKPATSQDLSCNDHCMHHRLSELETQVSQLVAIAAAQEEMLGDLLDAVECDGCTDYTSSLDTLDREGGDSESPVDLGARLRGGIGGEYGEHGDEEAIDEISEQMKKLSGSLDESSHKPPSTPYVDVVKDFDRNYDQLMHRTFESCGHASPSPCTQAWMDVAGHLQTQNRYLEHEVKDFREMCVSLIGDLTWHMDRLAEVQESLQAAEEEKAAAVMELGFATKKLERVSEVLAATSHKEAHGNDATAQKEYNRSRGLWSPRIDDESPRKAPKTAPNLDFSDINTIYDSPPSWSSKPTPNETSATSFVFYPRTSTIVIPAPVAAVTQCPSGTTLDKIQEVLANAKTPAAQIVLDILAARELMGVQLPDNIRDGQIVISIPEVVELTRTDILVRVEAWETTDCDFRGEGSYFSSSSSEADAPIAGPSEELVDRLGEMSAGSSWPLCFCDVCTDREIRTDVQPTTSIRVDKQHEENTSSARDGVDTLAQEELDTDFIAHAYDPPSPNPTPVSKSIGDKPSLSLKTSWNFNDPLNHPFPPLPSLQLKPHLRGGADADDDDDCDCDDGNGYDSDDDDVDHEDDAPEPWSGEPRSGGDGILDDLVWNDGNEGLVLHFEDEIVSVLPKMRGGAGDEEDLEQFARASGKGEKMAVDPSHTALPPLKLHAKSDLRDRWRADDEGYLEKWKEGIAQRWKENDKIAAENDIVNKVKVMKWLEPRTAPAHAFTTSTSSAEDLAKNEQARRRYRGVKTSVVVETASKLRGGESVKARPDSVRSVISRRALRKRIAELLKALIAYIKRLLEPMRMKRPKAVPIRRTGQLVTTPTRQPSFQSHKPFHPLPNVQDSGAPAHKATPASPQRQPVPPEMPLRNSARLSPWCPPTVAGPSNMQKSERLWMEWQAKVQKGVDEYDGMQLPHVREWQCRFGGGWVTVKGQ